jgi:predicted unusual protein kinase regulating ubiquinone biosynthesis (AarF/ABC1/UbiB family)
MCERAYWSLFANLPSHCSLHSSLAAECLDTVLTLGGGYVKMAQKLCGTGYLRVEYDNAFSCLLDSVPATPFAVVKNIVENEFGCPLDNIYKEFSAKPIRSTSIGQDHFARLTTGEDVVVKIQHPDIKTKIKVDVEVKPALDVAFESWVYVSATYLSTDHQDHMRHKWIW